MPGVAQVVAISVGHSDEGLNGVNVLLFHFCNARAGCQQGEPCQSLHICIPLQLLQGQKKRKRKKRQVSEYRAGSYPTNPPVQAVAPV